MEVNETARPERATIPLGITASWNAPIDSIDPALLPEDKRKMLMETQQKQALEKPAETPQPNRPAASLPQPRSQGLVLIPAQAIKLFKRVLDTFPSVEVVLTPEQAESLLSELQLMKTPKSMSDAKAIIRLFDRLEEIIEGDSNG